MTDFDQEVDHPALLPEGARGKVITRIPGGGDPGEVELPIRGCTETFFAYADQEIPVGSMVLVWNCRDGRHVDVVLDPIPDDDLSDLQSN